MAESKRVREGSKTKGSSVTQQSEAVPFYQGINIKTSNDFSQGLVPVLRSGPTLGIFRDGKRMRQPGFDDTNDIGVPRPSAVFGEKGVVVSDSNVELNESRFEERLVFDIEKAQFGVAPNVPKAEPFADLMVYNPVSYIQDEGLFMYPVNLWNLGELPKHEFNGIIEPLDIRSQILGLVDSRFDGHAPRGALTGPFSERPWGSKEIKDSWFVSDNQELPWLDAPLIHTATLLSPVTDIYPGSTYLTGAFTSAGYTYTAEAGAALEFWPELDATPTDNSGKGLSVSLDGTAHTFSTVTVGDKSYSAWEEGSGSSPSIDFGQDTTGEYWDARIGFGAAQTTPEYPHSPGVSQFTVAIWINPGVLNNNHQVLFSMGQSFDTNNQPSFTMGLSDDIVTSAYPKPSSPTRRPFVEFQGGTPPAHEAGSPGPTQTAKSQWATAAWDVFTQGTWRHLAAVCTVVQGNLGGTNPPTSDTVVQFYVDGQAVTSVRSDGSNFHTAYGADNQWRLNVVPAGHVGLGSRDPKARLFGTGMGSTHTFEGQATQPAIWSKALTANEIRAVYEIQRSNVPIDQIIHYPDQSRALQVATPLQGYQNIEQAPDDPMQEQDYHDRVYKKVSLHNGDDIMDALRLLNSSSCNSLTDPFERSASRGFCTGNGASSIIFNDTFVVGDYE